MVCSSSQRVATATASATARAAAASCTSLPSTAITCRRATSVARSRDPVGDCWAAMKVPSWARIAACVAGSVGSTPMLAHHLGELGVVGGLAQHPARASRRGRRGPCRRGRAARETPARPAAETAPKPAGLEPLPGEPAPGRFRGNPKGDSPRVRPASPEPGWSSGAPCWSGPACSSPRPRQVARDLSARVVLVAAVVFRRRCGCRHRVHGRRPCLLIPTRTDLLPAVLAAHQDNHGSPRLVPRIRPATGRSRDAGAGAAAYDCGRDGHPCRDP